MDKTPLQIQCTAAYLLRFYYSHSAAPLPFSPAQLEELRKTSLARVTCDNGDRIHNMQPLAFRTPSPMYESTPHITMVFSP